MTNPDPTEDDAASTSSPAAGEAVTLTVYTSEPKAKVDEINRAFTAATPDIEVYRAHLPGTRPNIGNAAGVVIRRPLVDGRSRTQ